MEKIELPSIFNNADIAKHLWPNNVNARAHLSRKLSFKNGQSLNDEDKKRIIEYAEQELKELKNILK